MKIHKLQKNNSSRNKRKVHHPGLDQEIEHKKKKVLNKIIKMKNNLNRLMNSMK